MPTTARPARPRGAPRVAFVLGGGGHLGACEVGMLQALLECGVVPDLIVGTSVGAINGAAVAAQPDLDAVERLAATWERLTKSGVLSGSLARRMVTLARSRTHAHPAEPLRDLLTEALPVERIEDLAVQFQCVAASIERAREHWFTEGSVVDAVLASSAVPGLLPPVRIGDEHFIDGGVVNSIPVNRAVALGATTVYVLQVGRIEDPLTPPRWPWEVGLVAFEIARRHRYLTDMASLPEGVRVHVLPTGMAAPRYNTLKALRYSDFGSVRARIRRAHAASRRHLHEHLPR